MTIQLAYQQLLAQLYSLYDRREAAGIADMTIEHVTGHRKIDRILYKEFPLNEQQQTQLEKLTNELMDHRPVQYVLGEAWFMNMKFTVNEHVLIPRPETEELAEWIIRDIERSPNKEISLLDIGTGSGCIPIAIRKKIPQVTVSGVDVSDDALQVAILNSIELNALVDFLHVDFLQESEWKHLGKYHIIVSNPPYIKQVEKTAMRDNVLKFEPELALFVPDEDALVFYKAIATFGLTHLKKGGCIYVEINETLGKEVVSLFEEAGYQSATLRKDIQGKYRMVKASRQEESLCFQM